MSPRLQLLFSVAPTKELLALQSLAEFLGVPCDLSDIQNVGAQPGARHLIGACVLDVASAAGADETRISPDEVTAIVARAEPILFLVTRPDERCRSLVQHLTDRLVTSVVLAENAATVRFTSNSSKFCHELASQSFSRHNRTALHLVTCPDFPCTPIMEVGDGVSFLAWSSGSRVRFMWSTPCVLDTSVPLDRESDFEGALDSVLPFVIFLRWVFPDSCWHNPDRTAGFVIDDPLLTPQYGFIDFPELLASARENAYHVTLAFIPWNARRTRERHAALFRQYSDVFGLCVHGCDHNSNEYGSADYDLLRHKNRIALARMDRHAERVGLPYAPLFVCPQEQCSIEAWRALAADGRLLGMVNTGCLPRNVANTRVCATDLLLPAQDAVFGFPVFKRHYSGSFSQFALALFLGRPAILVEHHEFFRNGLDGIEAFARNLRQVCPTVRWSSLHETTTTTHLRRRESDTSTAIRFFTNRFRFDSTKDSSQIFRLRKRIHEPSSVRRVLVDGVEVPFAFESEFLTLEVVSTQPRFHQIEVEIAPAPRRMVYSFGLRYQSGVAIRRLLSEMRDNVLSKHRRSAALAKKLADTLHLSASTAGHRP